MAYGTGTKKKMMKKAGKMMMDKYKTPAEKKKYMAKMKVKKKAAKK